MTFLKSDPRRARDLDPLPAEVLTADEQRRATLWKLKWGAQAWTREPGIDPKNGESRELRRLDYTYVPLVELDGQQCYCWLEFLAWRRDHEGLAP